MLISDIARLRLHAQQLSHHGYKTPQALVAYMGPMQAQDYHAGKYAIGTRLPAATLPAVEKAIHQAKIIRTWVFRGTLHLMVPEDIRWMTALVKDRLQQRLKAPETALDVDAAVYPKIFKLLRSEMKGGRQLLKSEIEELITRHKFSKNYMMYLLQRASLEGIICHGPLKGKQFTFTLLDEWSPGTNAVSAEAALGMLATRFFTSHGPATVADFMTYGGITLKEANVGLEIARPSLECITLDKSVYWCSKGLQQSAGQVPPALLLPAFDEILVAYKDRSAMTPDAHKGKAMTSNGIFHPIMLLNGQLAGLWKRTIVKDCVDIELQPFHLLKKTEKKVLEAACHHYANFMQLPLRHITYA
ncbi:winged helix DNA-binding domain-containing protein [Chitinophaga sp. sic0106]|uniref:winged helix DNA-binding domain-containing protein n=1 Tax=Chitinophaga sp. sic0106 TaxID=2854785 RepID=UPI001C472B41|nr:winged helix DNA-binding domain-containing protein [Chitinophaga sp. sic0106]MBV7533386.1 winged helix DNA-binding domain-containing protein [Chitinophaga sp. sic0106]